MTKRELISVNGIFRKWSKLHILRYKIPASEIPLQKVYEQIQRIVIINEKKLETVQKLLKLKLITKGVSLTALVVYYKVCNALLRVALKIL